jgi:hypothetical protein
MELLPYELTSYAFREFSWEPAQTLDQFKSRMANRYFGPGADLTLTEDLIYLRHFAIEGGWAANRASMLTSMAGEFINYDGKPLPKQDPAGVLTAVKGYSESDRKIALDRLEKRLVDLKKIYAEDIPRMESIERRMASLEPSASRRAKASFELIRRFIKDTRNLLDKIGLKPEEIAQTLEQVAAARTPKG